jgi:hypothetical protein
MDERAGRRRTVADGTVLADAIDQSFDAPGQPDNRRFSRLKVTTLASIANLLADSLPAV